VLSGFSDKLKGFGAGLVAAFGIHEIGGAIKDTIGLASDLNEALSKNTVVFGAGADQIAAAAKDAYKTVGLSEKAYNELAGTVGVLGKAAGKTGDDLGDFGNEVLQRAADIGSFNNAATSDVIEAWGAAMRGEMEPMRRFGVLLDDNALRTQALSMGLVKNVKDALTPQQKALAANALILKQTSDAAGDFARTSDGLANKQRILKAQIENVKTEIGKRLLPVFSSVVGFISSKLGPAIAWLGTKVVPVFKAIGDAVRLFIGSFTGAGADVTHLSGGMIDRIITLGDKARAVFDGIKGAFWSFVESFKAGDGDITSDGINGKIEQIGYVARLVFNWIKDVGIPAVVSAFKWLQQNVPPVVAAVTDALVVAFQWVRDNVVPIVQQVVSYLVEQFGNLVDWVKANWPAIEEAIVHVAHAIADVAKWVADVVTDLWDKWGSNILTMAKNIWSAILSVINAAIDAVRNVIMTVVNLINGDWGKAWDSFKGILRAAWDAMFAIVQMGVNNLWQLFQIVWTPFGDALYSTWEWIKAKWDSIVQWVSELPNRITGAASGMWDGIKNTFRAAINWIVGKWNSLKFTIGGGSFLGVDIPSMTLGVPQIPMLADGGIVTRPTLALIGERGPEAVVPLRGQNAGMGGGDTYVINASGIGDRQLAQVVLDALQQHRRTRGSADLRALVAA